MLFTLVFSNTVCAYNEARGSANQSANIIPIIQFLLDDESGAEPEPEPERCTSTNGSGVFKLNLNHVLGLPELPLICELTDVEDCIKAKIKANIKAACRHKIDVFVPGTKQEGGDWKQFRKLVSTSDDRSAISLGYSPTNALEDAQYDKGVIKSRAVLRILLRVLANEFDPEQVRVFGHSKGSHGVAMVADDVLSNSKYSQFEFYAFGQPGRTKIDIDGSSAIDKARLGTPGFIQKLSDNLVGITWENDEVKDYTGEGSSGLKLPLSWRYPGRINGASKFGSGAPLYARIDHHNTYGGDYTEEATPYCYAGSGFTLAAFRNHACIKKVDTRFRAYFWGHLACKAEAYGLMKSGAVGAKSWIGFSGPRAGRKSCAEKQSTVSASYKLKYRYNRADSDCKFNMKIRANGYNSPGGDDSRPHGGSISLTLLQDASIIPGSSPKQKNGSISLPLNMTLVLEAKLIETDGFGKCNSPFQTESYVPSLEVTFTHPVSGASITRELITNSEGTAYPVGTVHNKDKIGWRRTSGSWNLEYDTVFQSLKIEGKTNTDSSTKISMKKYINLLD